MKLTDTNKMQHTQILDYYKRQLSLLYGNQSKFSKKWEISLSKTSFNTILQLISNYINKDIEYIKEFGRDSVYRAYVSMLLTFNEEHDDSRIIAGNGYNRVLTHLYNSYSIIDILYTYIQYEVYIDDRGYMCFGEYIIQSQYNKDVDTLNSNKLHDFLIREYNNKLYISIVDDEISGELMESEKFCNGFGGFSYMVPINHKDTIQTMHIKGKDWIKEYIYKPKVGYLYFLKLNIDDITTYKVGISSNIETRFSQYEKQFIVDNVAYKLNMLEAAIIERYLHHKYYMLKDNTFIGTHHNISGTTELYHEDLHNKLTNHILDDSLNQLDSENYPIPSYMLRDILDKQNIELDLN